MTKEELLKPRLVECVDRMQKLLALNAPSNIIGAVAFSIFSTTLACYGEEAGWALIGHLRAQNLHERAVCNYGKDCTNPVDRPDMGICPDCEIVIGCDPQSMAKIDAQCDVLQEEWDKQCDSCDGTGLMEGWNQRDGNDCPKCKGTGIEPEEAQ